MKYIFLSILFFITGTIALQAQSLVGYNHSSNELVGGIFANPAHIAGNRYKADVNVISINAFVANNAVGFPLFRSSDTDYSILNSNGNKQIYGNADIMLPSFMLAIGKKQAIGVTSRVRFLFSETGMSDDLLRLITEKKGIDIGTDYTQPNTYLNAHGFADFGITYARILFQNEEHLIKAGITGKYYMGLAAGTVQLSDGSFQLVSDTTLQKATGTLAAIYSNGIDDVYNGGAGSIHQDASGYGFDFGVVYEWKKPNAQNKESSYILRASVAVSDIGSLKYPSSSNSGIYTLNVPRVTVSELLGKDQSIESVSEYIDYLKTLGGNNSLLEESKPGSFKVALPAYLRINVDYNFYKNFFVNLNTGINLKSSSSYGAHYANVYTVTPRWETAYVSLSSPVGYSTAQRIDWGIGVNVNYFFIGSGNVFSSLLSTDVSALNVYFGVHIPIGDTWKKVRKQPAQGIESASY